MFDGMTVMEIVKLLLPLLILQLVLIVIALRALIKTERVRFIPKWGWALIIILGELLGPILFFIFGREKDV